MREDVTILVAEDDEGHFSLIRKNIQRAGITNPVLHFKDGQELLDFLFHGPGVDEHIQFGVAYLLLLDIRMPKVDGIEVLTRIKQDTVLCKIPVTIITTTDDPKEIEKCHLLGCSSYVVKPIEYEDFAEAVMRMTAFLSTVEVPVTME